MKKFVALLMALALLCTSVGAFAEPVPEVPSPQAEETVETTETTEEPEAPETLQAESELLAAEEPEVTYTESDDFEEYKKHEDHNWEFAEYFEDGKYAKDDIPMTCTTPLYKRMVCTECHVCFWLPLDESKVPGHHEYECTEDVAPTETTEGHKTYVCKVCKDTYSVTYTLDADFEAYKEHTDHDTEWDIPTGANARDNIPMTCTTPAYMWMVCEKCHVYFWLPVDEDKVIGHHDYEAVETTPATETSEGLMTYTCKVCGDEYTEVIPKLEPSVKPEKPFGPTEDYNTHIETPNDPTHKAGWYDPKQTVQPTCTEDGKYSVLCEECGDLYDYPIEKLGHDWKKEPDSKVTTERTCTKDGEITYTGECKRCNKTVTETVPFPATGHNFEGQEGVVIEEAFCEKNEVRRFTCTVCKYEEDREIKNTALAHVWKDETEHVVVDLTCAQDGSIGTAQVCDRCGKIKPETLDTVEKLPALNHKAELEDKIEVALNDDGTIAFGLDVEAGCLAPYIVYTAGDTTYDLTKVDVIPEYQVEVPIVNKYVDKATGTYHEAEVDYIPATCKTKGSLVVTCTECEASYELEIPAHPHQYEMVLGDQEGDLVKDCTKPNSILYACVFCGDSFNQAFEPAKEHTWIEDENIVSFTQKKAWDDEAITYKVVDGDVDAAFANIAECYDYTVTVKCAVWFCEKTHDFKVEGDGKHQALDYEIIDAPSCTEPGRKMYNCIACGKYVVEPIKANGHIWADNKTITEPTCTKEGVREQICTVCKATRTEVIPAIGHHFVTTITPANCKAGIIGSEVKKCSICGLEEVVRTWSGHEYEDEDITAYTAETCTKDGSISFVCNICHKDVTETIDALGHTYEAEDYEHVCITEGANKCVPASCKTGSAHPEIHNDVCERCGAVWTWEDGEIPEHNMYKIEEDGTITLNRFVIQTLPTCKSEGKASYRCSLCGDLIEDIVLAPLPHNWDVKFNTETGAYQLECVKLELTEANAETLEAHMIDTGCDELVAHAIVEQLMRSTGENFAGIGCGEVETIKIVKTEYTITKIADKRGRIELVEGAQPTKTWPLVRITWRYTKDNGDTVSFTTCRMVTPEAWYDDGCYVGTFKLSGLSAPSDWTCDFIYVEVVTDEDADEMYMGDYATYGEATIKG